MTEYEDAARDRLIRNFRDNLETIEDKIQELDKRREELVYSRDFIKYEIKQLEATDD